MRFWCINVDVPDEITQMLRAACIERGVSYKEIHAPDFDFDPKHRLPPGDILYRPAVATSAMRVEQFLFTPGVATFHTEDQAVFYDFVSSPLMFQRAGLPIPRTVYCASADRQLLDAHAERLGGFPLVVKQLGGQGGVGVMIAESRRGLYALMDHLIDGGSNPLLCAYIPDAMHWRVVVVGERAVAAYRNPIDENDFRTYSSTDPDDYTSDVPTEMARIAMEAVRTMQSEFGGVDLLEHESGRLYLLEANVPCYFPQAQETAGIDVAGPMLDHLIAKARGLAPGARPEDVSVID